MARYPTVSLDGGPGHACYLEMDGIERYTEWSVRFEIPHATTLNKEEADKIVAAEADHATVALTAKIDICPGVQFQSPVRIYTRREGDIIGGASLLDVTLMGTGEMTACPS
jgi:hypothetical protein